MLVVAVVVVDDDEEEEGVTAKGFDLGGSVVVFVPGAEYAVNDVAVYGGGVMRDSTTFPSGCVEAITSDARASDVPVADVRDADVVIDASDAVLDVTAVDEASDSEAEVSDALIEDGETVEAVIPGQLGIKQYQEVLKVLPA